MKGPLLDGLYREVTAEHAKWLAECIRFSFHALAAPLGAAKYPK